MAYLQLTIVLLAEIQQAEKHWPQTTPCEVWFETTEIEAETKRAHNLFSGWAHYHRERYADCFGRVRVSEVYVLVPEDYANLREKIVEAVTQLEKSGWKMTKVLKKLQHLEESSFDLSLYLAEPGPYRKEILTLAVES